MASLSTTRNIRKARSRKSGSVLKSLPNELLLEVIAKVASNSFDDLCRVRQSCKKINKTGQEDYVFQHVSFDKFLFNPLTKREGYLELLGRCSKCGNAEALYRQGMLEVFNSKELDFEPGFQCLKKAAARGHREATHVYGVLVALGVGGDEVKQQGLKLLSSLESRDLSRERIMACMRSMWVHKPFVREMLAYNARAKTCSQCQNFERVNFVTKGGWDDRYDEDDKLNGCDSCKMNREVNIFCDRLCTEVNLVL